MTNARSNIVGFEHGVNGKLSPWCWFESREIHRGFVKWPDSGVDKAHLEVVVDDASVGKISGNRPDIRMR